MIRRFRGEPFDAPPGAELRPSSGGILGSGYGCGHGSYGLWVNEGDGHGWLFALPGNLGGGTILDKSGGGHSPGAWPRPVDGPPHEAT